ncbi:MAG TPA: TetR/AcrR family transcriptional regulator [Streptosporangiaceae bacterium]|jgi:AcrR family transcriptional regulator|nr:TetR/AcrR family transcriptional regulator [Streptosporangiaceae bacterium]
MKQEGGVVPAGGGSAASARRTDPRRARTRAALISAAQRLLAEGRTEVSIQQITETAGVGFGSFYNHFEDKDELWSAAVAATLRAHGDMVAALTGGIDDPAEVFCVGLRLTGRLQRSFPELARVLLNTGLAAIMASQEGLLRHARRDIIAAVASGRFDITDIDLALHITAGSLLGLVALLDTNPDLEAGPLADQYATRVLRAFGLSQPEVDSIAARPLPDLTANIATGGTTS